MHVKRVLILGLAILLAGCDGPATEAPSIEAMATQVAATLTALTPVAHGVTEAPPTAGPLEPTPLPPAAPPVLRIAFTNGGNIWLAEGDAPAVQLTSSGNAEQVWISSDGQQVVFTRRPAVDGPVEVRAVHRDGTGEMILAPADAWNGLYAHESFLFNDLQQMDFIPGTHRLLLNTRVTPNMVTAGTLVCGLLAGWLLSRGHHAALVAGSLVAWVASMLDGVDGELARAKFQSSAFGHWLEMACDYVFYIALFVGLGLGLHRVTGETRWLVMGVGAGAGVIPSFAAVAQLKRIYARRGSMGDFYLAYERTVTAPGSSLFLRVTPHLAAFMTRAVFPYFLVAFAVLGITKVALVLMFVATQSFWIVAFYASRLRVTLRPAEAMAIVVS